MMILLKAFVFLSTYWSLAQALQLVDEPSLKLEAEDLKFFFGDVTPPHYSIVNIRSRSREKRSVVSDNVVEYPDHIDLTVEDESGEVELELHPNNDLISPNFKLVVRGGKGEILEVSKGPPSQQNCVYVGNTKGNSNTAAALSTCDGRGFTGVLIEGDHSHLIRPLRRGKFRPKRDGEYSTEDMTPDGLHIVHSRNNGSLCGVHNLRAMMAPRVFIELPQNEGEEDAAANVGEHNHTTEEDSFGGREKYYNHVHDRQEKEDFQSKRHMWKREAQKKYLIETAIFVDDAMYNVVKSKEGDNAINALTAIVLAIMNGVYVLYKAPSMRTNINLSLVRLEIMEEKQETLDKADGEIDRYLANFCSWQRRQNEILNPDGDSDPDFWDHALLLSGLDLWEGVRSFTSVIGLAWVAGMCTRSYSCTINEGTSFEAVYVIAHEMGHNLNMSHDGSTSDGNSCPSDTYVMSPSTGPGKVTWSVCSTRELENFVSDTKGSGAFCLRDVQRNPKEIDMDPSGKLPGMIYDIKKQCLFALGNEFTPYVTGKNPYNNVCRELWCQNRTHALRTHPALEGTACDDGNGKLCISGGCVTKSDSNQPLTTPKPDITENEIPREKPNRDPGISRGFGSSFTDLFVNIRNMFNKYLFAVQDRRAQYLAQWAIVNLTSCSVNCGGGWQTGEVICIRRDTRVIEADSECHGRKPPAKTSCNTLPCRMN